MIDKVVEGTHRVLELAKLALAAPASWSGLNMDADERLVFARAAHVVRFGQDEDHKPDDHAISPVKLLEARRVDDRRPDLWSVFNVVQENTIRGGLRGVGRDALNRPRRVKTRAVNGIDQDVKLNRALWLLADEMAKLKGAPALASAA